MRGPDDTWREVAGSSPLSFPVGGAAWAGDRVVVVAGGPAPSVYTLDPSAGAWRRLETDITLPDNGIVATATGGVVIAAGTVDGCAAGSNPCAIERRLVVILIDPASATVRAIDPGPLSVPAVGLPGPAVTAMVTDQEGVLVLAVDRTVQRPELATGTWRQVGAAGCSPSPEVAGLAPIWTGERLVVVCSPTQAEELDPRRQVWVPMTARGTPPAPTAEPVIVWAGDRLLIWSGVASVRGSPTSDQGTTFTPAPP